MTTTGRLVLTACLAATALALTALGGCSATSTETDEPTTTTTGSPNPCPQTQLFCEGECTVVELDPDHCGQCGRRCGPDQVCSSGECGSDCTGGTTKCGDVCVNLMTDQQNCGQCENACPAGHVCDGNGGCQLSCPDNLTDCGGSCVDTDVDPDYCGDCTHMCSSPDICNGEGVCDTNCANGLVLCSQTCIDPQSDEDFCGASGDCQGANAGDVCGQAEICEEGNCQAVTCNDQWEQSANENDTEATATSLAAEPIPDDSGPATASGVINGGADVDWYAYEGEDTIWGWASPRQRFEQASHDARLCVFLKCVDPNATTQFTCPSGTTSATSPGGRFGCCATGSDADFEVTDLNCTGTGSEDVYVYIRVDDPNGNSGTCTSYVLEYYY